MWKCPSCGMDRNEDGDIRCPGCGFSRRTFLTLTGNGGTVVLHIGLTFGSRNLTEIVGNDDACFAERRQFEIVRDGEIWRIYPLLGTRNATAVNGVELPDCGQEMKDGDTICIMSRCDSTVTRAMISVSINS